MNTPPPIEVLRERLKAFLVFLKTKLLASGADLDRLAQLRRLSDVRLRKFALGKPHVTAADLGGLLSDAAIGRFDAIAEEAGLARGGHFSLPLTTLGEETGYAVEACLTLQIVGAERMRALLKEFVLRNGPTPDLPAASPTPAPLKAVPWPLAPAVSKILGNVRELWTIPAGTLRILDLLYAPDTPPDAVCAEIEKDPGLAAQCLRVVNSANFALGTRIASVKRAVVTLGYQMTRRIVTISSLVSALGRPHADLEFDLTSYWRHSLWVAHAASLVSKATRLGHPDEHFAAGLMHDIGKLVEYQFLRGPMKELLAAVRGGACFVEEEVRRFGTTHAEIGACLAEQWRFPPSIIQAVRHHLDSPEQLEEIQLPREANVVATMCHLARKGPADVWGGFLRLPADLVERVRAEADVHSSGSLEEAFITVCL